MPERGDQPARRLEQEFGFLTMAFGAARYLRQAENLALSLRLHMPGVPIAVVSDTANLPPLFDTVIAFDAAQGMGVMQKLFTDRYSPFGETLFIDSDCIVTRPFWAELEAIRQYSFTPACEVFFKPGDADRYNISDLRSTLEALNIGRFPKFNGGVYYFRRDRLSERVFESARDILEHWQELGLKPFQGTSGPNDETVFGLAMEVAGAPVYNDFGKLMRSPMELVGRLQIDPLGGGTRFQKADKLVEPAICHFNFGTVRWPEYLWCERLLRGKPAHAHALLWLRTSFQIQKRMGSLRRLSRRLCKRPKTTPGDAGG